MTPAFTITITADSPEQLQANLRSMLPQQEDRVLEYINGVEFQSLLIQIGDRVEAEGYEMEVWKKGERDTKPIEELPQAARKKEEARAKLRGDLVASLAEATHATTVVKDEIEIEVAPVEETPPEVKTKVKAKAKTNGKAETPDALKARTIIKLQELYSAGKKAEVNKLLAQYGDGSKTFSSIPAEQFAAIAEAAEAI